MEGSHSIPYSNSFAIFAGIFFFQGGYAFICLKSCSKLLFSTSDTLGYIDAILESCFLALPS